MNSDVVQSVLHLSSACADEAHTPQLRAAGQITGVRPGMTDVLGERQRVQGARAPRWSGASALLRPLADLQLPPPSVGNRRHGVTGVLQADPARVTGSNAITWPVTRFTGTSSVTAKVVGHSAWICRCRQCPVDGLANLNSVLKMVASRGHPQECQSRHSMGNIPPVSYTHLTLPTKRIV